MCPRTAYVCSYYMLLVRLDTRRRLLGTSYVCARVLVIDMAPYYSAVRCAALVRRRMLTYAEVPWTYADVCRRMLTYAEDAQPLYAMYIRLDGALFVGAGASIIYCDAETGACVDVC